MTLKSRLLLLTILLGAALVTTCDDGPTRSRPDPPLSCGGIQGLACPAGQTCELPPGQCQTADLLGVCEPIPENCITLFDPVCGCDGVTYSNDCFRQMARVQKAGDGECPSTTVE